LERRGETTGPEVGARSSEAGAPRRNGSQPPDPRWEVATPHAPRNSARETRLTAPWRRNHRPPSAADRCVQRCPRDRLPSIPPLLPQSLQCYLPFGYAFSFISQRPQLIEDIVYRFGWKLTTEGRPASSPIKTFDLVGQDHTRYRAALRNMDLKRVSMPPAQPQAPSQTHRADS